MDVGNILDWMLFICMIFIVILLVVSTTSPKIQKFYAKKRKQKSAGKA